MTESRERRALAYIRDSIVAIGDRTKAGAATALRDEMLRDAIMWRLQTLAEAATTKLPEELRARHPEVRWGSVAGFRNVVAHGYMDLDWDEVARVIDQDLPMLRQVVEQELARQD